MPENWSPTSWKEKPIAQVCFVEGPFVPATDFFPRRMSRIQTRITSTSKSGQVKQFAAIS